MTPPSASMTIWRVCISCLKLCAKHFLVVVVCRDIVVLLMKVGGQGRCNDLVLAESRVLTYCFVRLHEVAPTQGAGATPASGLCFGGGRLRHRAIVPCNSLLRQLLAHRAGPARSASRSSVLDAHRNAPSPSEMPGPAVLRGVFFHMAGVAPGRDGFYRAQVARPMGVLRARQRAMKHATFEHKLTSGW